MKDKYLKLNNMVSEYSKQRCKTINKFDADLESCKKKLDEVSERLEVALRSGDEKSYKQIRESVESVRYTYDFISGRKFNYLNESEEDVKERSKELLDQVRAAYYEDITEYISNIAPLLDNLETLNNSIVEDCKAAYEALRTWHTSVREFTKVIGYRDGEEVRTSNMPSLIDTSCITTFAGCIDELKRSLEVVKAQIGKEE